MNLKISSKAVKLNSDLRARVTQKFLYSFSRFQEQIERLSVMLVNGKHKRGGRKIECIVRAKMVQEDEFIIRERDTNLLATVAKAVARTKLRVSRVLDRRRPAPRRPMRAIVQDATILSHDNVPTFVP